MLYLGIDQHGKQLTVNLRDEDGRVLTARQVSTEWQRVRAFFAANSAAGPSGRRLQGDPASLRIQRLVGEDAAGRVRLCGCGAGAAGLAQPQEDRSARCREALRAVADQSPAPGARRKTSRIAAGRAAHAPGCREPPAHHAPQTLGRVPHQDAQQNPAHPHAPQSTAGMSHAHAAQPGGAALAGEACVENLLDRKPDHTRSVPGSSLEPTSLAHA